MNHGIQRRLAYQYLPRQQQFFCSCNSCINQSSTGCSWDLHFSPSLNTCRHMCSMPSQSVTLPCVIGYCISNNPRELVSSRLPTTATTCSGTSTMQDYKAHLIPNRTANFAALSRLGHFRWPLNTLHHFTVLRVAHSWEYLDLIRACHWGHEMNLCHLGWILPRKSSLNTPAAIVDHYWLIAKHHKNNPMHYARARLIDCWQLNTGRLETLRNVLIESHILQNGFPEK